MPTIVTTIPPQQAVAQARSKRRITRLLRGLHFSCDAMLQSRAVEKRVGEERKALAELHPEFAAADLRSVAVYWLAICLPFAIWLVDICLLSAVAEYLATVMFPDRPELVLASRLLVALAVVAVEMGFAARLHDAYETAEESEDRLPYRLCWAGALVWAAFLSACLIATQQAAGAAEEDSTRTLMYALAGFCFMLHLLLPFSHQMLHEAKGYLLFHLRDSRLRALERRAATSENAARREATTTFQHYAGDLNHYNVIHSPAPMSAGPFSVAVRTVVNELFGEGTIPPPNRLGAADSPVPAPPPPSPVAPPNGAGTTVGARQPAATETADSENEYLRMVLSRRQQDEESEVRP